MLQSCNKVFPKFVKISRYLGGKVLEWNSFLKFNKKKERKKDKFPFRIREISYEKRIYEKIFYDTKIVRTNLYL